MHRKHARKMRLALFIFLYFYTVLQNAQADSTVTAAVPLPYGPSVGDQLLNTNDEGSVNSATTLSHPLIYMEHRHSVLYISQNGVVSFSAPLSEAAPRDLDMEQKDIISIFYAPSIGGNIYFRSSSQASSLLCREISAKIRRAFTDSNTFQADMALLITWENLQNIERNDSNTFQLALVANDRESYAVFVYNRIAWFESDHRFAQAGFFSADGRSEKLIYSGTSKIQELTKITNFNEPGLFLYRISSSQPSDPRYQKYEYEYGAQHEEEYDPDDTLVPCPEDPYKEDCPENCKIIKDDRECSLCICSNIAPIGVNINLEDEEKPPSMAADLSCKLEDSPTQCHASASCVVGARFDASALGCCECAANQLGNGVKCLPPKGPAVRIDGTLNGAINGQRIEGVDLYTFVDYTQGQQNTALTRWSGDAALGATLLDSISSVMGWLFAKTSSPVDLPNGFQLTGGTFNRTVNLHIGDRYAVKIYQSATYLFNDKFSVYTELSGTLPELKQRFSAKFSDYEETYRKEALGLIRAISEREIILTEEDSAPKTLRIVSDQQISFIECPYKAQDDISKTIKFEYVTGQLDSQNIVRFASRTTVVKPQVNGADNSVIYGVESSPHDVSPIDICQRAAHICNQPNMKCRAYGPSYRCECEPGFNVKPDANVLARFRCIEAPPPAPAPPGPAHGVTTVGENGAHPCTQHTDCHQWGECIFNAGSAGSSSVGICKCREWYVGDGVKHCGPPEEVYPSPNQSDITQQNQCAGRNCDANADCVANSHDTICMCRTGYSGNGLTCVLESEPTVLSAPICNSNDQCGQNAVCQYDTGLARHRCHCVAPFRGDGRDCVLDVRDSVTVASRACEMQLGCHERARCVADGSQPICQCIDSYKGDGRLCVPVNPADELLPPPPIPSSMTNGGIEAETIPEKTQQLPPAIGTAMSEKMCKDQLECHSNAHCELQTGDRYICQCLPGYKGDGFNECILSEECSPSKPNTCPPHSTCQLSMEEQKFTCQCHQGFLKLGAACIVRSPSQPLYPPPGSIEPAKPPNCLDDKSMCSPNADCMPNENSNYICICKYGYRGNGRMCSPVTEANDGTILIGRGMSIIQRSVKLDVPGKQLVVVPHQVVVDLSFDCVEQRIYWSDISGHSIRSIALNGTGLESHYTSQLRSPEGIAIDWSSRNLYYVDSIKNELGVASLDGKYRKTLLTEGLVNPRAMVIDVEHRHIYYSDWHRRNAHIGRMDLDGSNNRIFLSEDIHLPNGLTLLHNRKELCWVDAGNQRLSCIRLDGNARRVVYQRLEYPFGLTCYREERFYWTDWKDHKIHTVSIYGDGYTSFMPGAGGRGKIYGIISVPIKCHGAPTECAKNNGDCAQLCLPSNDNGTGRVCKCADDAADCAK